MKTKFFLILIVAVVIQSCKKKDEPAPTPVTPAPTSSGCLVKTVTYGGMDVMTYTFDNNYKVISFVDLFNETTNQVTYTGNTITTKKYNSNSVLISTKTDVLNSDDNMSSSTETGIDTLYGSSPLARNYYDTVSYQYDANKFLLKEIHKQKNVEVISGNISFENDSTGFVIQNENIISASQKIVFSSGGNVSVQTTDKTFTYSTQLNKSKQMVDANGLRLQKPAPHKGKTSKYLIHTSTYGSSTSTYTFTLDSNGNVKDYISWGDIWGYTYLCY